MMALSSVSSKAHIHPDHPRQDEFLKAQEQQTSPGEYERHLAHLRRAATVDGIDRILDEYGLDVIIGPADSFITSFATGSGTFKDYDCVSLKMFHN